MRISIQDTTFRRIVCVIIAIAVAFAIFFVIKYNRHDKVIAANVTKLEKMEKQSVAANQAAIKDVERAENVDENNLENADFRKIFEGCVIAGDSITEGVEGYGYLDKDIAVFERGVSIESEKGIIKRAIALKPDVLFLSFGLNDLELYNGNSKKFVKAYSKLVKKLRQKIPETKLCINSVLPATKAKISRVPALGASDKFNKATKAFCEKENITFIDHTAMVKANPQWYEPDGQHFISEFYPRWLYNMAKGAGLL
ncbi:MAG: hypothetical protein IKE49_00270 [Firmicutes bacterium]|nr:hypothetical protein [Bacillota bacterium]